MRSQSSLVCAFEIGSHGVSLAEISKQMIFCRGVAITTGHNTPPPEQEEGGVRAAHLLIAGKE